MHSAPRVRTRVRPSIFMEVLAIGRHRQHCTESWSQHWAQRTNQSDARLTTGSPFGEYRRNAIVFSVQTLSATGNDGQCRAICRGWSDKQCHYSDCILKALFIRPIEHSNWPTEELESSYQIVGETQYPISCALTRDGQRRGSAQNTQLCKFTESNYGSKYPSSDSSRYYSLYKP